MPEAKAGSVEDRLHALVKAGELAPTALLVLPADPPRWLHQTLDHRAIGVVYNPHWESRGNYVPTRLGQRYDAFCWLDTTTALHPLHRMEPTGGEDATWPSGQ